MTQSIDRTQTPFKTSRSVSLGGGEKKILFMFLLGEKLKKNQPNPFFD